MTIPKGSPLHIPDRTRSVDDTAVTVTTRKRPADEAFSALSRSPSPSRPADASGATDTPDNAGKRPRMSGLLTPVPWPHAQVSRAAGKRRVDNDAKPGTTVEPSTAEEAFRGVPEATRKKIFAVDGKGIGKIGTDLDLSLGEVIAVCDETIRRNVKMAVESPLFQPGGTYAGSFAFVAQKVGLVDAAEAKAFHEELLRPVQPFVSRSVMEGLVDDRENRNSLQDMARRSGLSQREVKQVLDGLPARNAALVSDAWPQDVIDEVLRRVVGERIPDMAVEIGVSFGAIMQLRDATVRARVATEFACFTGPQEPFEAIARNLELKGGADEAIAYYHESLRQKQPLITDRIITNLLSARIAGTSVVGMAETEDLSLREVQSVLAEFPIGSAEEPADSARHDASEAAISAVGEWLRSEYRQRRDERPPDVETLARYRGNFDTHPAVQAFLDAHSTIASADLIHGLRVRRVTDAIARTPLGWTKAEPRIRLECGRVPLSLEAALVLEERLLCLREFRNWAHSFGPKGFLREFASMKGLPFHNDVVHDFHSKLSTDDFLRDHVGAAVNLYRGQPVNLTGVYIPLSAEAVTLIENRVTKDHVRSAKAFVMSFPPIPEGTSFEQFLYSQVVEVLGNPDELAGRANAMAFNSNTLRDTLLMLQSTRLPSGVNPRLVRGDDKSFFGGHLEASRHTDTASKRLNFFEAYGGVLERDKLPSMKDHVLTINLDRGPIHETVKNIAAMFIPVRAEKSVREMLIQLQKYVIKLTPPKTKCRDIDKADIDSFIEGMPNKTLRSKQANESHRAEYGHAASAYSNWLESIGESRSLVEHLGELDVSAESDVIKSIAASASRTPWDIESGLKAMQQLLCSSVIRPE